MAVNVNVLTFILTRGLQYCIACLGFGHEWIVRESSIINEDLQGRIEALQEGNEALRRMVERLRAELVLSQQLYRTLQGPITEEQLNELLEALQGEVVLQEERDKDQQIVEEIMERIIETVQGDMQAERGASSNLESTTTEQLNMQQGQNR